jgi:hypothetical protein
MAEGKEVKELKERMQKALERVFRIQTGLSLLHSAAMAKANDEGGDFGAFAWDVINQLELVEADVKAVNELMEG